MPIRLITIKNEILDYLAHQSSDIDRAQFWMSVRETQRPIDKRRTLSFPVARQGLSYMDRQHNMALNLTDRSRRGMQEVVKAFGEESDYRTNRGLDSVTERFVADPYSKREDKFGLRLKPYQEYWGHRRRDRQ